MEDHISVCGNYPSGDFDEHFDEAAIGAGVRDRMNAHSRDSTSVP